MFDPFEPAGVGSLDISLFGPTRVACDGFATATLPRPAQLALAILVLAGQRGVDRDSIVDTVWPDIELDRGRFYLRRALMAIRASLGSWSDCLVSSNDRRVALAVSRSMSDLGRFQDAVEAGDDEAATACYRGQLLLGHDHPWAVAQRLSLQEQFIGALERLADSAAAAGEFDRAIHFARRAIGEDPLRESAWRRLFEFLGGQHQFAQVTREYREMRRRFQRDLKASPSPTTEELYAAIIARAQAPRVEHGEAVIDRSIPAAISSLVGRSQEVERVLEAMSRGRLVTVVGLAGVGKSRVMQAAVSQLPDGAVWLDLVGASSVGEKLLDRLQVTDLGSAARVLTKGGVCLLVLDSAEGAALDCRAVVEALLAACPSLTILCVCVHPLQIPGEVVVDILPLPWQPGGADAPAVRLFLERAATAHPSFSCSERELGLVVEICGRLDGIPLAIELAALSIRSQSLAQIAEDVRTRFPGGGTSVGRHGTLERALAWTFELLGPAEQELLIELAVFPADWSREAARSICDVVDFDAALARLVNHSLVQFDGVGRYKLLETVRQFAAAQKQDQSELRLRHAAHYASLVETALSSTAGSAIDADEINVITAVNSFTESRDPSVREGALRLANRICARWMAQGRKAEALRLGLRLIDQFQSEISDELAELLLRTGGAAHALFQLRLAEQLLSRAEQMLDALGLELWTTESLRERGQLASSQERLDDAERLLTAARDRYLADGDRRGAALCIQSLGYVARQRADFAASRRLTEEALSMHTAAGDEFGRLWCLGSLGATLVGLGEFETSQDIFNEALTIHRRNANLEGIAWNSAMLAEVALHLGNPDEAIVHITEGLHAIGGNRDLQTRMWPLSLLGEALTRAGRLDEARAPLDEAAAILESVGPTSLGVENALRLAELYVARGDLGTAQQFLLEAERVGAQLPKFEAPGRLIRLRERLGTLASA